MCEKGIANYLQVARARTEGNKSVIKADRRSIPRSRAESRGVGNTLFGVPFVEVLQFFAECSEGGLP
jgi:hypothetical protein